MGRQDIFAPNYRRIRMSKNPDKHLFDRRIVSTSSLLVAIISTLVSLIAVLAGGNLYASFLWLNHNILIVSSVILTVITLLLVVTVQFSSAKQLKRSTKEISYEIIINELVSKHVEDLNINLSGTSSHESLSQDNNVTFKVWNSGKVPILPADFDRPIVFDFGSGAKILDAKVLETTIPEKIKLSILNTGLTLDPIKLDSEDSITVKVLVENFAGKMNTYARIAGLKQLRKVTRGLPTV